MKKTLIAALLGFSALAQAHEVWVATPAQLASNNVLKADLAYHLFMVIFCELIPLLM